MSAFELNLSELYIVRNGLNRSIEELVEQQKYAPAHGVAVLRDRVQDEIERRIDAAEARKAEPH